MGNAVRGLEIGGEICEALGLDAAQVRSIIIKIEPDDVVIATTEITPCKDKLDKVKTILSNYELHKK